MRTRTAVASAAIATGAVAAGVLGRAVFRRRHAAPWVDVDPPEDLGTVVSFDGTRLAVRAAGDPGAPVIVLSHGFSLDASTWGRLWPELAGAFRVVVFDHRSHGRSAPAAHGDLSLRAIGRDLAAVLEAASPDAPAVVVGHSMGAMAILALAEQRPELFGTRILGAAFLGAAPADLLRGAMGSVTDVLRPRFGSLSDAARRVDRVRRAVLAGPADVSAAVARLTQFGPDAPPEVVDHVVALAERARREVWVDGLANLMQMDLRHAVPRVTVPALVVVGAHDRVTPPAAGVELAGLLPDGRLRAFDDAGHMVMLERPEELAAELAAFARAAFAGASREGAA